jgi:hypothetical protein
VGSLPSNARGRVAGQTELYFYFLPVSSTQFKIQSTDSTASSVTDSYSDDGRRSACHQPNLTRQDGSTNAMSVSPFSLLFRLQGGRDSSVGVATRYWLDGPGSNPSGRGGGARFSSLAQTCPGAHPACCAMGTGS